MRIVFFGTPSFAAHVLQHLLDCEVEVAAVVTQPDRPKGRALQLTPSPVKELAQARAIPILQPEKASQPPFLQELRALHADLFVVVAFGQILPQALLDIPPLGCINVHASLLPKYRGAAPMQRALLAGDTETGIAIQKMVLKLDAGDVIATAKTPIAPDMTFGQLQERLLELSGPLLFQVIQTYSQGVPSARSQDESLVSFAPKITPEERLIDWNHPAVQIHNLIRALSPNPSAWCHVSAPDFKKRLKILKARPAAGVGKPGTLLSHEGMVACGKGAVQLLEVQPEGKNVMKAADWLRGQKNILFTS